jgi:hypothetical protein
MNLRICTLISACVPLLLAACKEKSGPMSGQKSATSESSCRSAAEALKLKKIAEDYLAAATVAAKESQNEDALVSFFLRSSFKQLREGTFQVSDLFKMLSPSINMNDSLACIIEDFLQKQKSDSFPLFLVFYGGGLLGGAVHMGGDLFAEGFYRTRALGPMGNMPQEEILRERLQTAEQLSQKQPWFERLPQGGFAFHKEGAQKRILQHVCKNAAQNKLKLYRGTSNSFLKTNSLWEHRSFWSKFGSKEAVFFTTDRKAAIGWASPLVLEAEADCTLLDKGSELSQNVREAYIGMEGGSTEIAILQMRESPLAQSVFNATKIHCHTGKEIMPDLKNFPVCP